MGSRDLPIRLWSFQCLLGADTGVPGPPLPLLGPKTRPPVLPPCPGCPGRPSSLVGETRPREPRLLRAALVPRPPGSPCLPSPPSPGTLQGSTLLSVSPQGKGPSPGVSYRPLAGGAVCAPPRVSLAGRADPRRPRRGLRAAGWRPTVPATGGGREASGSGPGPALVTAVTGVIDGVCGPAVGSSGPPGDPRAPMGSSNPSRPGQSPDLGSSWPAVSHPHPACGPPSREGGLVGQVPGRAGPGRFALLKGRAGGKGSLLVFPVHLKKNPLVSE